MDKSGLNEKQVVKMLTFRKDSKLAVADLDKKVNERKSIRNVRIKGRQIY